MSESDIVYSDLLSEEKAIFRGVRSQGFNVSPRAIRQNAFQQVWAAAGNITYYTLSGDSASLNEGAVLTVDVVGQNVADATDVYWTLSGSVAPIATYFSEVTGVAALSGEAAQIEVSSVSGASILPLSAENFNFQIRTDSYTGEVKATVPFVINDVV